MNIAFILDNIKHQVCDRRAVLMLVILLNCNIDWFILIVILSVLYFKMILENNTT